MLGKPGLRVALCLLIALCLMAPIWPVAHAVDTGVAKENVILRSKASAGSVPLATIREGKEVLVDEKQGDWYKVRTGALSGYVKVEYIDIVKSSSSSDATATQTSASLPSSASALQKDAKGEDVKALQRNLKELGYFDEEITGYFGDVTLEAVMAFQRANGLSADGVVGKGTLNAINNKLTAPTASTSDALKKGAEGDLVKQLQMALKERGYFSEDITGYYGSKTEEAVAAFQRAAGLSADGVAGPQTLTSLLDDTATTVVKLGDTGSAVQELQRLLKSAGFYTGSVDGKFGDGTQESLLAFQKAAGLSADGVAGKQTIAKLASGSVKASSNAPSSNNDGSGSVPIITNPSGGSSSNDVVGGNSSASESTRQNGSLRLVDWWSGEIDSVFPRKSIGKMIDLYTGITINVYRYGGSNHLDWEPATADDMAKVTQMVNGDYSWSARPVIFIAPNGNRYAAATNTMPHGGEHLTDNNCNGQMCMHFLNSYTHGGKKPNAEMQSAIQYAFRQGG